MQPQSSARPKLSPDPRQIGVYAVDPPSPGVCSDGGRKPLQIPGDDVDLRRESIVAALSIFSVPDAGGRDIGGGMRVD
ncbi:hypothetical protein CGRA01v4_04735 [Colletotrichum graminicola]|uniref:Uncharacterized protein n=1 Tax=Colletotrichum graminicola (strain M1.001 / M2 / FGSC 10212) TaxID=645133 RepID=E3QLI0_COLGM|nr:uncharacterized protein GLRG_06693 [Colletotrichum graminicola M1.001]EFQ31718.1 hypothetical protein GLRG_06693 [Colletotrichum graminicola M1.001]WDK13454.1 hypothetical protein CGRA01v4_04735 [Colletotrichum graminicola]